MTVAVICCTLFSLLLQLFYGPLSGTTRVSWYQKKHSRAILGFMVQGMITDADTPTIQLDNPTCLS